MLTGTLPTGETGINDCLVNAPVGPSEADIAALYTDACGGAITVVKTGTPTGTNCAWTVTYNYTVRDACNNFVDPSINITYSGGDTTPPLLTGTLPIGQIGINDCLANAPVGPTETEIAAQYTDACGGDITVVKSRTRTGTNCAWTVTYNYTIRDACNNFVDPSINITYTGGDTTAPTLEITSPPRTVSECVDDINAVWNAWLLETPTFTATDNCSQGPFTLDEVLPQPAGPPAVNAPQVCRMFTVRDACDNVSQPQPWCFKVVPGDQTPLYPCLSYFFQTKNYKCKTPEQYLKGLCCLKQWFQELKISVEGLSKKCRAGNDHVESVQIIQSLCCALDLIEDLIAKMEYDRERFDENAIGSTVPTSAVCKSFECLFIYLIETYHIATLNLDGDEITDATSGVALAGDDAQYVCNIGVKLSPDCCSSSYLGLKMI